MPCVITDEPTPKDDTFAGVNSINRPAGQHRHRLTNQPVNRLTCACGQHDLKVSKALMIYVSIPASRHCGL